METYKVVIVEDEPPAAKRLCKMLNSLEPNIDVVEILDSIESAVSFFQSNPAVDLILMDIQLGDGISFEIFAQAKISAPVIFTTAYDEYSIQAFKVNSIDYLLKPIENEELEVALAQFKTYTTQHKDVQALAIDDLMLSLKQKKFKERFLIKKGKALCIVYTSDISYFHSDDGYAHITTTDGTIHIIDHTMDQLESITDPEQFYRINRKLIINLKSIASVHDYFNSRLKLKLQPAAKFDVIVARERVRKFKLWLDAEE